MNTDSLFLTKYGLQHYVAFSKSSGADVFSIKRTESRKMIDHARNIVSEMYGAPSTVRLV